MRVKPGALIANRYRIVRELAEGGMGAVYVAQDEKLDQAVAIKITGGVGAARRHFRARFQREAKIGSRLGRTIGFVRATDWGDLDDGVRLYLAMDLVEDATPLDLSSGSPQERLERLLRAARLVAEAHQQGVIHRDIKPANFLQAPDGVIHLTDFGIAKVVGEEDPEIERDLTTTGVGMGTPRFMAPEQFEDAKSVDSKADVYALGVMLFQVLSGGRSPFEATNPLGVMTSQQKVLTGDSPLPAPRDHFPQVPDALNDLCLGALALDPARRITAQELVQGLEAGAGSVSDLPSADQTLPPPIESTAALAPTVVEDTKPPHAPSPAPGPGPADTPSSPRPGPGRWVLPIVALLIGVGATFLFLRPPGETGSSTDGTSGKTDSDPSSAKTGSGSGKTDGGGSSDPAPRPNPDAKPGAVFLEDTFTKRTRLGSAWKLLDPDPERWQLKEDGLLIIARIPTNEVDPKTKRSRTIIWNILELQPALPQDYEITVEWLAAFEVKTRYGGNPRGEAVGQTLQLELHTLHRQVGCRVTHKSYDNSRRYQLARWMFKTIKAKTEWIPNSYEWVPRKVEPRPVLLRITKQGTRFKTYLMVDQAWFEIGAMDVLHMKDPRVRISQFVEPDSPTLSPETQAIIKRVSIVAR